MSAPGLRGQHLHLDCASGAAGDMTIGALIDAGVPASVVREALEQLGVGGWRLGAERVVRGGLSAIDVKVNVSAGAAPHPTLPPAGRALSGGPHAHAHTHTHTHEPEPEPEHAHAHEPAHEHEHGHAHGHAHHHWRDIRTMIESSSLDRPVVARAVDIFVRVARAEAKLHGTTVDDVAFHEVGAIDAIVDIVGAAAALEWLTPSAVTCTAVHMGNGTVGTAHGVLPVPSPAALEILREVGAPVLSIGPARELCTPTGAAILAHAVTAWTPMPALVPLAIGHGAGDLELPDRPNVMRAVIGRAHDGGAAEVVRIEANIDDMSPELCDSAVEALFAAGALDAWWTAITMKKGRPALQLSALAPEPAVEAVARAILRETSSIGVRFDRVARRVLERRIREVDTAFGRLPVKDAILDGEVVNSAPELEPAREAARHHGVPLKQVLAAVVAAAARPR